MAWIQNLHLADAGLYPEFEFRVDTHLIDGGFVLRFRTLLIAACLLLSFFATSETHAAISVINVSVPQEIAPGESFNVTYTLSGTSTLAVAELRFYLGASPTSRDFGPLNESFQLPLIGTFPSFGPPAGPQTRFIRMPTSLQSFGCFPSGTWYFILQVDSGSQNADSFQVAPLSISSFTPQSGPPCTPVTVNGNKFGDVNVNVNGLFFNGTPAVGTFVNDTTITTNVPPGATTGPIQLPNSCSPNPGVSSPSPFFVTPFANPPVVNSFTPTTASVGAFVQIFGENFTDTTTAVLFNGTPASRVFINPQLMVAFVPNGATDGPITVGSVCEGSDVSTSDFIVDPHCLSAAEFLNASRIDSVRLGNLEYVNNEMPSCTFYTNNSDLVTHVFPGQTGLPIQIGQGSCDANNFNKVTKLFVDWNGDTDFSDPGELVLTGPPFPNALLSGTFSVPPSAVLGPARMRIVTQAAASSDDVTDCGLYNFGETQDYTLEISACAGFRDLPAGNWHSISIPCDPGLENTVQDLFADDLSGVYGIDWALFTYDVNTGQSSVMALGDTVETGRGYWLKTRDDGQSIGPGGIVNPQAIGMGGQPSSMTDMSLVADPAGRSNLVGFPYTFSVDWADVQVVDGGNVLTLDQADPVVGLDRACDLDPPHASCVMSRLLYRWNGAAYETFNGATPGAEGVLSPLDGLWVKAFKSGISLRIPAVPSSRDAERAGDEVDPNSWFIRLIAESGNLRDAGNILGESEQSVEGYDLDDLAELPPFGQPNLTVVFPHPDWEERADDYTTDFRPLNLGLESEPTLWHFEVRSSDPTADVTLSWEGSGTRLLGSELFDEETGERVTIRPGASYSFTMTGPSRHFEWSVQGVSPSAGQIFADGFESGNLGAWQSLGSGRSANTLKVEFESDVQPRQHDSKLEPRSRASETIRQ